MPKTAPARDVAYDDVNRKLVLPDGKRVSYVTTPELADIVAKPVDEVSKWRIEGRYPVLRFSRIGNSVRYPASAVVAFLESVPTGSSTAEVGSAWSKESNKQRSVTKRKSDVKKLEAARVK